LHPRSSAFICGSISLMPETPPPRIVLAVGLPGSGKSTYFAKQHITPLSSDWLREVLADDVTEQRFQASIFAALRYLLRLRLKLGRPVTYIDATSLTRAERANYIRIGREHGCEMEAIFFDVPLEVCRKRNQSRKRRVPEEALLRLAGRLQPPEVVEGFGQITTIDALGRATVTDARRAD
jgi:predicted kinase